MDYIVISYIRKDKKNDIQLKYLLRSIKKFLPERPIIIIGDNPFHFLDKNKILYHCLCMNKKNDFPAHAKAASYAMQNLKRFFFIYNGIIFQSPIKDFNKYKIEAMKSIFLPKKEYEKIKKEDEFTFFRLKTIHANTYITYPFMPWTIKERQLAALKKRFPEILTDFFNTPNILANLLPISKKRIYSYENKRNGFISSFLDISKHTFSGTFFIKDNILDEIVIYELEKMFPQKSPWEK